jgi:hypothetical protein
VRGDSADERCTQVLRRLTERREPMLIVLDSVSAWGSGAQPGPLPEGSHVQVLITTRERNLGGPRFVHLELGFLAPPHDRALIETVAARDPAPELDALLAQLGDTRSRSSWRVRSSQPIRASQPSRTWPCSSRTPTSSSARRSDAFATSRRSDRAGS